MSAGRGAAIDKPPRRRQPWRTYPTTRPPTIVRPFPTPSGLETGEKKTTSQRAQRLAGRPNLARRLLPHPVAHPVLARGHGKHDENDAKEADAPAITQHHVAVDRP